MPYKHVFTFITDEVWRPSVVEAVTAQVQVAADYISDSETVLCSEVNQEAEDE